MKIQGRIINVKRHTIGFKVGGVNRSRAEAVRLARQNRIDGVTVRTGSRDEQYIASIPGGVNLYDLPARLERSGRVTRRAAK